MRESGTPSTPIETVIPTTRVESPRASDTTSEKPASVEEQGYAREQLFQARALEDELTQTLVGEYTKAGDTLSASELIRRVQVEHDLREGSTREIFRIRDRKDANITHPPEMDTELARIPDDNSEESMQVRKDLEDQALEAKTLRSEVQKIEISNNQPGKKIEAVFKPQDGEPHILVHGQDAGTLTNHKPRGHLREWLAGFVAKACGVDRVVPATVIREVEGRVGSVQEWVKGELAVSHLDWEQIAQQADIEAIAFIDYILENADRHTSNFLINDEGRAFAIDHGAILSLKKENGALRSFPLRAVSGKPISEDLVARIQFMIDSEARMKALEEAFTFVLGEDAAPKFAQFKGHLEELASSKLFPQYRLGYEEDEAHFSSDEVTPKIGGDTTVATPRTEIRRKSITPQTVVGKK